MSYYSGKDGTVTYNGDAVAKVSNWSVSSTVIRLKLQDWLMVIAVTFQDCAPAAAVQQSFIMTKRQNHC